MNPLIAPRGSRNLSAVCGCASDAFRITFSAQHEMRPFSQTSSRSMATVTAFHPTKPDVGNATLQSRKPALHASPLQASRVLTTIYSFPTMKPLRFEYYPANHLHLPLRRDLLHRAVVYEGDKTRQGTASTKWRSEIHGSHRKVRPQKGTGQARLGIRGSPTIRGGGVAFGPKPRDFSTDLPRKMYDLAWRTALSYRFHRGELYIMEDGMEIDYDKTSFIKQIFERNSWGNAAGRSLLITASPAENLMVALEPAGDIGKVLVKDTVDVKGLLGMGRLIVEKSALDGILRAHESDLRPSPSLASMNR